MSDEPLLFAREAGIARLTLNRPAVGNAIDLPMARALMHAATECDEDSDIRCVVLTGTGRLFCAGGDIATFAAAGEDVPRLIKELAGTLHSALSRFARMEKPLVTAINGPAAGAGLGLAVLGDIALAVRTAHFTMAYTAIGLSPDGGSTWLLPRLIGLRRTQEMAFMNRRLTADEAAEIGLITRAVNPAQLESETNEVVTRLASLPTAALGRTRTLLLDSFATSFEAQMEQEAAAIVESSQSPLARHTFAAFLAKRDK